jgi:hypothetical protein
MTQAFNLSQLANKVNSSGLLDVATGVTGTQAVANGGTGQSTYTDGQLLIGNSTGNTLTKATITAGSGITVTNGSGAITIAASGGGSIQTEIFSGPGIWTKPASASQVRVTVIGGGGGGSPFIPSGGIPGKPGGSGGLAVAIVPVSAPVAITVGAGGSAGGSGGTSSFGPFVSATGGSAGGGGTGGDGTGTVSTGTTIRRAAAQYNSSNTGLMGGIIYPFFTTASAVAFSTTGIYAAGGLGIGAPSPGTPQGNGAIGGAILVEYVG